MLIRRISADHQEVRTGFDATMSRARRENGNVTGMHRDFAPVRASKDQPGGAARKGKRLMHRRMIMMERIDAISPLRRPTVALEQRLEFRRCHFISFVGDNVVVKDNREKRVFRNPIIFGQNERFRFHFGSEGGVE